MKKVIEFLRKLTTLAGITGNGVHTFYSLIVGIVFFYFGMWFDNGHSILAGFMSAIVLTSVLGVLFELAQGYFKAGTASMDDIVCDMAGGFTGGLLMLILELIF
jgi:VanZ family protein